VGYLPALFDNIDTKNLVRGAESIKEDLLSTKFDENILLQSASFIYGLYKERNISQTVFMPYSSLMRDLSFWFVQLWAESLGKKVNLNGEEIKTGLTPIPAYGATDQHSQVQLFMEGPHDKLVMLLEVDSFNHDFSLNNSFEQKALKRLAPFNLGQLMKAEHQGTLKAFKQNSRPYLNIKISKCDETNIGGLIMFLESLTALMGNYLNINPFDQPGVEAGKLFAFEWLDSPS
jgi:glucose-6-phosphate isomerase